jgi:hypothetical protein
MVGEVSGVVFFRGRQSDGLERSTSKEFGSIFYFPKEFEERRVSIDSSRQKTTPNPALATLAVRSRISASSHGQHLQARVMAPSNKKRRVHKNKEGPAESHPSADDVEEREEQRASSCDHEEASTSLAALPEATGYVSFFLGAFAIFSGSFSPAKRTLLQEITGPDTKCTITAGRQVIPAP